MNVYRVSTFAKPSESKFQYFAHLRGKRSDEESIEQICLKGVSFGKKWKKVRLYFEEPLWPRAHFYTFVGGSFVCTEHAKWVIEDMLSPAGEFLPVTIQGEDGIHYLYNVTNSGPFLDPIKSVMKYFDPTKSELVLAAPAFNPKALKNQEVFKIREDSFNNIFCVENCAKNGNTGFKALIEAHDLIGLKFELAWSKSRGPVPKYPRPTVPGMGWITGDGKPFRTK